MSFERRFTGSNDEPEIEEMPEEMAKAFREAFKPKPQVYYYCNYCYRRVSPHEFAEIYYSQSKIKIVNGKAICRICGRFASKDVVRDFEY